MRTTPQSDLTDATLATTAGDRRASLDNPDDTPDQALEPRARLQALVRVHGPAVARVAALYESNAADRQDLVQQIWLAAWRAWPDFRGECSERTFLLRIAHNRAVTALVRRRSASLGLEGIPQAEIAEILGITASNVAVTLHRARTRLRAWLEETT